MCPYGASSELIDLTSHETSVVQYRGTDRDLNLFSDDFNFVSFHVTWGRRAKMVARGQIEGSSMPGAGHLRAAEFAFPERSTPMRAGVVYRVE
jgi:hypothetical protein